MTPRIRIKPSGGTANQLLQYMFAANIQRLVGDLDICGYHLPELGLVSQEPTTRNGKELRLSGQHLLCEDVIYFIKKNLVFNFHLRGLGFRLSNYAPAEYYRGLIKSESAQIKAYGREHVVFHIRGGDILRNEHPDYFPIPFSYIDAVLRQADALPVFLGQLEDSYYTEKLRNRYPHAVFSPLRSPIEDFETLRHSHQVAISISSFSWVAAWLSNAARIHVPVAGMLNPQQRPDIDLLPVDDERYSFYHFDLFEWKATPHHIESLWQEREHPLLNRETLTAIKHLALRKVRFEMHWARLKLHARAYLTATTGYKNTSSRQENAISKVNNAIL